MTVAEPVTVAEPESVAATLLVFVPAPVLAIPVVAIPIVAPANSGLKPA
ncbi:MAG: hypothetical protein PVI30_15430 [Myxococcales bacterium]